MSASMLRRPVPVRSALAGAFGDYVARLAAAGVETAELWRLEVRRDGSVWVALDTGERSGDGLRRDRRGRRATPCHRLACDIPAALELLTR